MRTKLTPCGCNADWATMTWLIGDGIPNRTAGARYLIDGEDGTWAIVRRYYADDDFAGATQAERDAEPDKLNDLLVHEHEFNDTADMIAYFVDAEKE